MLQFIYSNKYDKTIRQQILNIKKNYMSKMKYKLENFLILLVVYIIFSLLLVAFWCLCKCFYIYK